MMWLKIPVSLLLVSVFIPKIIYASHQDVSMENQLKAAVADGQKKMGNLDPWQSGIYSEEVVPQFQRFIRDYSQSGSGLKVEIDYESIKHYLFFYAPKVLKEKEPKVVVFMKMDSSCSKCQESDAEMKKLVRSRVERRGWRPIWVSPENLNSADVGASSTLEDQLLNLAKDKKASGYLMVQWSLAPEDDIDTAHADEKRYIIRTSMQVGDTFLPPKQKELLDTDSFEVAGARLLTDMFTDLGAKFEVEMENQGDEAIEDVSVDISGIRDFNQYVRLKASIANRIPDASLEDHTFSKGRVVFVVHSKRKSDDIRSQLSASSLDPGNDQSINWVVK